MSTLPALTGLTMLTQWRVNWLAMAVAAAALGWYLARWHGLMSTRAGWSAGRIVALVLGVIGYLWCTNGFLNAYAATLFWVWSIQVLVLLLVIPVLLMAAQPLELATRTARHPTAGRTGRVGHLVGRVTRLFAHPFLAPALVPIVTTILFFGHVAGIWTSNPTIATLLGVVLLGVGCLLAAGLTVEDTTAASLAVGLALAVSVLELLTDAIPGIVLRLDTHLVTHHFAVTHSSWAMSPLADQKLAGSILWGVAELLDIPFLFVMFLRWVRADEREARRTDQVLEPQPASAHLSTQPDSAPSATPDKPWWLGDPELSHRLGLTTPGPADRGINPTEQR